MLTKNKVLLLASANILERMDFEAIQRITDVSEVPEVWANNKTPIMFKVSYEGSEYPELIVPDEFRKESEANDFMEFCHSNDIECGEVVTHQSFEVPKDGCFLCSEGLLEAKGRRWETVREFNLNCENFSDIIIMNYEHFFVKIELGCFIEGMVMINPKDHIYSQAMNPEEYFEELATAEREVEELLKAAYGDVPVIFFEHGSAPTGYSSHASSIVHAHTHVAPGYTFDEAHMRAVKLRPIGDIRELRRSKYMSYKVGHDGTLYAVNDPKVYVQRQYPRQVLAEKANVKTWNWRLNPCVEEMHKTFETLYKTLTEKADQLDPAIIERAEGFISAYPIRFGEN